MSHETIFYKLYGKCAVNLFLDSPGLYYNKFIFPPEFYFRKDSQGFQTHHYHWDTKRYICCFLRFESTRIYFLKHRDFKFKFSKSYFHSRYQDYIYCITKTSIYNHISGNSNNLVSIIVFQGQNVNKRNRNQK